MDNNLPSDVEGDADDYRDPDAPATGGYRSTVRQLVAERAAEGVRFTLDACRNIAEAHGCDPMLASSELRRAMFQRIGGEGFDAEARPIISGKAALGLAALTLRADTDRDLRAFPLRRADAAARICVAEALEAWQRGDDAAAREAMRAARDLMGDKA